MAIELIDDLGYPLPFREALRASVVIASERWRKVLVYVVGAVLPPALQIGTNLMNQGRMLIASIASNYIAPRMCAFNVPILVEVASKKTVAVARHVRSWRRKPGEDEDPV